MNTFPGRKTADEFVRAAVAYFGREIRAVAADGTIWCSSWPTALQKTLNMIRQFEAMPTRGAA
ncbi:hypothetical protein [Mesorhizobium sp.]|uniref:hypothetical protein n=1 Tax=Mesorhizobium sp. TaxID=1871066 RepID=UPI000FE9BD33|nr:hypothetical protein [Mesorhizobium sp.]RWD27177.1 MAG: hypothetical protein EOS34_32330 [Mesorhizobium sp.]RWD76017.1 MAG: hypothetical protein EOS48_31085 [Mesorhizobium sp.]TIS33827.1 MAG: hypothetical protein E5W95_32400 [Mesorhizobium sp.]